MSWTCPNCGFHIAADVPLPVHCVCEREHVEAGGEPFWLTAIRRLAKPTDRGVGDTVQRIASWLGGELFKRFSAKLGIPCGCTQRQAEWNARWPYDPGGG